MGKELLIYDVYGMIADTSQARLEWPLAWLHQACLLLLVCSK